MPGLLIFRYVVEKKVTFCGIFRDKFVEKMADFASDSRKFSGEISLKNDW